MVLTDWQVIASVNAESSFTHVCELSLFAVIKIEKKPSIRSPHICVSVSAEYTEMLFRVKMCWSENPPKTWNEAVSLKRNQNA